MKKIIVPLLFVSIAITSIAQTNNFGSFTNQNLPKEIPEINYRLYPTENMWTFVKLNTRTGRLWQVQYDIKGSDRFETYINILPLVDSQEEAVNDRFALYPTQNIYNFLLIDQIDGRIWQVQWSMEPENRGIIPIELIDKINR